MYKIYDLQTYLCVFSVETEAEANLAICHNDWLFWVRS